MKDDIIEYGFENEENNEFSVRDENFENSCAFTGHREMNEQIPVELLEKCIINLIEKGVYVFYCGMARGFDFVAAQAVIKLKRDYYNIKLIGCVPCVGQEKYYSEDEKQTYEETLLACDEVRVISHNYYNGCMYKRDRYMVDRSKFLVAFLRKKEGGTFYTFSYAQEKKREIYII